jgi:hypothetical protein
MMGEGDMLGAMYINSQFRQGELEADVNAWKKHAGRLKKDYHILHRDWYERGLYALTWRKIAEELYEKHYKRFTPEDKKLLVEVFHKKLDGETRKNFPYDPKQPPTKR